MGDLMKIQPLFTDKDREAMTQALGKVSEFAAVLATESEKVVRKFSAQLDERVGAAVSHVSPRR